jgi:transcription elongation factor GreB
VGYDEIFGRRDYISIDSPMARALVGKEEDDDVTVKTETDVKEWWINRIWYDPTDKL